MTSDRLLDRVRAANPVPAATISDDELFARIVAGAGDPRLVATPRRRRRRLGTRGLVLIAAAVVLTAGGGAFGAVQLVLTHASPKTLFQADPAGQYSRRPGQIWGGTGQSVIPQTVRRAASFTVPGVGRFEYWIALSKPKGWLCGAIRQPDGTWADLGPDSLLGGPVPGCGTSPWHDAHGFSYYPTSITNKKGEWRILYGYAPTIGHPVTVRDRLHGTTARIGDGRYFAMAIQICKGFRCDPGPYPDAMDYFQLETLDASGHVLVTDDRDPGM